MGWAYTVHTTCIPLELYTGVDVGVQGPTTDVRACILDDRDLERWSTSMWWGPQPVSRDQLMEHRDRTIPELAATKSHVAGG